MLCSMLLKVTNLCSEGLIFQSQEVIFYETVKFFEALMHDGSYKVYVMDC